MKSIVIALLLITLAPTAVLAQTPATKATETAPVIVAEAKVQMGAPWKNIMEIGNNGSFLVIKFQNTSGKVIQHIRFAAVQTNTFGDGFFIANCSVGRQGPAWAFDLHQPVKPGQKVTADWAVDADQKRVSSKRQIDGATLRARAVQVTFDDGTMWKAPEEAKQTTTPPPPPTN